MLKVALDVVEYICGYSGVVRNPVVRACQEKNMDVVYDGWHVTESCHVILVLVSTKVDAYMNILIQKIVLDELETHICVLVGNKEPSFVWVPSKKYGYSVRWLACCGCVSRHIRSR